MTAPLPLAIDTLTINEGTAFLIIGLIGVIPWGGFRLRSPAVLVSWALTVIVLVLTFITSMPLIWFWLMIILDVFIVAMAGVAFYLIN